MYCIAAFFRFKKYIGERHLGFKIKIFQFMYTHVRVELLIIIIKLKHETEIDNINS